MSRLGKLFRAAAVATLGATAPPAQSQEPAALPPGSVTPLPVFTPSPYRSTGTGAATRSTGTPAIPTHPGCQPAPCYPATPGYPYSYPFTPSTPNGGPGMPGSGTTMPGGPAPEAGVATPSFGSQMAGAGLGQTSSLAAPGGYLDNPIPITMFRMRYDNAWNINRPDRNEVLWPAWGELGFHPHGVNGNGAFLSRNPRGPDEIFRRFDYQELSPYFEFAANSRLSGFVEVPIRFIRGTGVLEEGNPEDALRVNGKFVFPEPREENTDVQPNNYHAGLSDINFGFKYAVIADPNKRFLTFQFRTYAPTGNFRDGLGNGHWTLEPGVLLYQRLTDRLVLQGQFRDWIPIGGTQDVFTGRRFSGNMLIYGLGLGYDLYRSTKVRVVPITEFVGWTVLDGLATNAAAGGIAAVPPIGVVLPQGHGIENASGNTIFNVKLGVRTYFGNGNDVYVGYGRAVTGNRWYQDILRLEYRRAF